MLELCSQGLSISFHILEQWIGEHPNSDHNLLIPIRVGSQLNSLPAKKSTSRFKFKIRNLLPKIFSSLLNPILTIVICVFKPFQSQMMEQ